MTDKKGRDFMIFNDALQPWEIAAGVFYWHLSVAWYFTFKKSGYKKSSIDIRFFKAISLRTILTHVDLS